MVTILGMVTLLRMLTILRILSKPNPNSNSIKPNLTESSSYGLRLDIILTQNAYKPWNHKMQAVESPHKLHIYISTVCFGADAISEFSFLLWSKVEGCDNM